MKPSLNSVQLLIFASGMVTIGVLLWGYNTVASVIIFVLVLAVSMVSFWNMLLDKIKDEERIVKVTYRGYDRRNRSIYEIERKMKPKIGRTDRQYGLPMDLFSESENTMEDYDAEIPIRLIDGIGGIIATRIEEIGIMDIDELAISDAEEISSAAIVSKQNAEEWILDAKCLFVGAQISSLIPLSMSDAKDIKKKIEKARKSGALKMPVDYEISMDKIERWIHRANELVSSVDVSEIQKLLEDND